MIIDWLAGNQIWTFLGGEAVTDYVSNGTYLIGAAILGWCVAICVSKKIRNYFF